MKSRKGIGGAPTKYKIEYCEEAYNLSLLGYKDAELATYFEVSNSTFALWKTEHPEFSEALRNGKEIADGKVVDSLYRKAIGYKLRETVIDENGNEKEVIKTFPPDTTAAIFWLKNRQRTKWRDRVDTEHSGAIEIQKIKRVIIDKNEE